MLSAYHPYLGEDIMPTGAGPHGPPTTTKSYRGAKPAPAADAPASDAPAAESADDTAQRGESAPTSGAGPHGPPTDY